MKLVLTKEEAILPGPHSDSSATHKAPPWLAELVLIKLQFSM